MKLNDLMPKSLRSELPDIGATEDERDPMIRAKFFYPDFSWTWYAIEFDGDDLFFGLVDGFEKELGYFCLSELTENRGKLGMEIERDLFFTPCALSAILPWWKER